MMCTHPPGLPARNLETMYSNAAMTNVSTAFPPYKCAAKRATEQTCQFTLQEKQAEDLLDHHFHVRACETDADDDVKRRDSTRTHTCKLFLATC